MSRVYDVPERRMLSTRRDAGGNSIPKSDFETTPVVHSLGQGSLGLVHASITFPGSNGDTVNNVTLVETGSGVFGLVEDDNSWD